MTPTRFRMTAMLSLLLLGAGLAGCATGDAAAPATPGQSVTLQPGERIELPQQASLRYVEVTADSRCPPGVQCIRAGDAEVAFEFTPAGAAGPQAVRLNMPERTSTAVGDWQLQLLSLEFGDAPAATVRIDPR